MTHDPPPGHPLYRYLLAHFGRPKRPCLVRAVPTPQGAMVATMLLYDCTVPPALRVAANEASA